MQLSNSIRIISILLFLLLYGAKGDCYAKEKYLEIKKEKDLHGGVWKLPKGITLLFNGGIIKNGTVVGSHTKIKASGVAFDNVKIRGTWDVKKISTSLFRNLEGRMVNIEKCVLSTKNKEIAIFVDNVSHVKILNNALKTRSNYTTSVENIIRKSIGKVEKNQ